MPRNRIKLVEESRTWMGTPWGPHAVKGVSASCMGFVLVCIHEILGETELVRIGRPLFGITTVSQFNNPLYKEMAANLERKEIKNAEMGDLMLFKFGNIASHVTIITGDNMIIHSSQELGKIVEHSIPKKWRKAALFSIPGIDD